MTIDKDFKRQVRQRMERTGEPYVVSHMHLLAMSAAGRDGSPEVPPAELTDAERDDLAALWLEIGLKRKLVPPEVTWEPYMYGLSVAPISTDWPGKKAVMDDLDRRMKMLGDRLAVGGEAAIAEWFRSRDEVEAQSPTELDLRLHKAWLDLRRLMAGKEFEVAPRAPLMAHELVTFGDPRGWRENRLVLKRMRWLMASGQPGNDSLTAEEGPRVSEP